MIDVKFSSGFIGIRSDWPDNIQFGPKEEIQYNLTNYMDIFSTKDQNKYLN